MFLIRYDTVIDKNPSFSKKYFLKSKRMHISHNRKNVMHFKNVLLTKKIYDELIIMITKRNSLDTS